MSELNIGYDLDTVWGSYSLEIYFIELQTFRAGILEITKPSLLKLKQAFKKLWQKEDYNPDLLTKVQGCFQKPRAAIYFFALLIHFEMTIYY